MKKATKKAQTLSSHPAYAAGYRAGVKYEHGRSASIIEALNTQIVYWRKLSDEAHAANAVARTVDDQHEPSTRV